MELVGDFLHHLGAARHLFYEREQTGFWIYLAGGAALGLLCWVACNYYTRLWNLRYRISRLHQALCATAALLTLVFALFYPSLAYMKDAAGESIAAWQTSREADKAWQSHVFLAEYHAAQQKNAATQLLDDRTRIVFPPGDEAPVVAASQVVVDEATRSFRISHPFLGAIFKTAAEVPLQELAASMHDRWARQPGSAYHIDDGVKLVASRVTSQLQPQTTRAAQVARTSLIVGFAMMQLLLFGSIGLAAYHDLKCTT